MSPGFFMNNYAFYQNFIDFWSTIEIQLATRNDSEYNNFALQVWRGINLPHMYNQSPVSNAAYNFLNKQLRKEISREDFEQRYCTALSQCCEYISQVLLSHQTAQEVLHCFYHNDGKRLKLSNRMNGILEVFSKNFEWDDPSVNGNRDFFVEDRCFGFLLGGFSLTMTDISRGQTLEKPSRHPTDMSNYPLESLFKLSSEQYGFSTVAAGLNSNFCKIEDIVEPLYACVDKMSRYFHNCPNLVSLDGINLQISSGYTNGRAIGGYMDQWHTIVFYNSDLDIQSCFVHEWMHALEYKIGSVNLPGVQSNPPYNILWSELNNTITEILNLETVSNQNFEHEQHIQNLWAKILEVQLDKFAFSEEHRTKCTQSVLNNNLQEVTDILQENNIPVEKIEHFLNFCTAMNFGGEENKQYSAFHLGAYYQDVLRRIYKSECDPYWVKGNEMLARACESAGPSVFGISPAKHLQGNHYPQNEEKNHIIKVFQNFFSEVHLAMGDSFTQKIEKHRTKNLHLGAEKNILTP